ncbi:MAG TPA: cyclic nucleotide-binding domain-containing protein [Mycobacteriales bacterium]|nr:cyclic nucleotide-binding domain-containing protein [Mycobacteriales bacterium]
MSRIDMLRRLPMFGQYSDEELVRIDALVYETTIPAGTALTVEGRIRRQAFIVLSGEASVAVCGAVIGRLGHGDLIGEMSLLNNQPQSATVIAEEPLRVLVMDPREFGTWVSDPRAARWLANDLSARLSVAQSQVSHAAVEANAAETTRATTLRGRRQSGPGTPMHLPA